MKLHEISACASAIGNQIKAGIPLDQALHRLVRMQPKYEEFWEQTAISVRSGQPLSDSLASVWPPALVGAVRAGEQSGKLEDVFTRIEETVALQMNLRQSMFRLAYPAGMGLAGLGVFLGFMVFVLPGLAKSLHTKSQSFVFELSSWLSGFVDQNWAYLLGAVALGIAVLVSWLQTDEAKELILDAMLGIPVVKDALRDMYFGLWANYMAVMVAAGIATVEALKLTAVVLPVRMRSSIHAFERDLSANNFSMADAADLAKQSPDDPRSIWWPFYVSSAFMVAEQTGEIDAEMMRVAPSLVKEGIKTLDRVLAVANAVALAISAFLIVSPLAAYYVEIFTAIRQAR